MNLSRSQLLWLFGGLTILTLFAALMLLPFYWMTLSSVKSLTEINRLPPTWWPEEVNWSNYLEAWAKPESTFGRYMLNSFIVAGLGTFLQLLISVPAAYALANFQFRGRNLLFLLIIATMLIPYEMLLIPNFVTIRHWPLAGGNDLLGRGGQGFYDSHMGIMLPFLADAFTIFLLRQAFLSIPKEFWEAAQMDGLRRFAYLNRVALPLVAPVLLTAGLLSFVGKWNGAIWPLLITSSESMRVLQVGMILFTFEEGSNYQLLMAASTFTVLPIVLLYLFTQRYFQEGVISSGLKG